MKVVLGYNTDEIATLEAFVNLVSELKEILSCLKNRIADHYDFANVSTSHSI